MVRDRLSILIAAAVLASACSDPITNAVFYEEEAFLDALPTGERFTVPEAILDADVGSDPLLAEAVMAAEDLQAHLAAAVVVGEALVAAPADDRAETYRSWEQVPVVIPGEDGANDFWLRATIVRNEGGALTWTIDGSANRIGPWVELGSGRHEPSDAGTVTWQLYGLWAGTDGVLDIVYAKDEATGLVFYEVQRSPDLLGGDPDKVWQVPASHALSFTDWFELTTDGLAWPGFAIAINADAGGRAEGAVFRDEDQVDFAGCWDGGGDTVWAGGDPGVATWGSETACVVGPILDD